VKQLGCVFFAVLLLALVACDPSPKDHAKNFVRYLPPESESWERDDKETVELIPSTVTNKGHITMQYEGPDGALAFIVVEAHPSDDAAEVAAKSRIRELLMRGFEFSRNRASPQVPADVTQSGRARYAIFEDSKIVVEIDVLAASDDNPVSDEAFGELLTMVRNAYDKVGD
jgi:hypothetical protein